MSAPVSHLAPRLTKAVPSLMSGGSRFWLLILSVWITTATGSAANPFLAGELETAMQGAIPRTGGTYRDRDGDGGCQPGRELGSPGSHLSHVSGGVQWRPRRWIRFC